MYLTRDASHMVVAYDTTLASLVPHAKSFTHKGSKFLLLPNNRDEAKLARNLGVAMPSPILTRYDWCGLKPWDAQRTTAALLTESLRCYVLSTMGTGKTRCVLWATDYLRRQGVIKRTLIVAPLSTLTPVWEQELFRVLPRSRVKVLYGSRARRLELLAMEADYYVVNHHGLMVLKDQLIARGFDVVVIDELATFRNRSTDLWKAANAIINPTALSAARPPRYAWGLTGSPTPGSPVDAWAQIRLLTPNRVARTMTMFQDQTMRRASQFRWIARPEANAIVQAAMQPSVRYTLDDIMELPETSYVDREAKLEADAAKAYKMLFAKMRMITQCGQAITAVNEGVLQGKLLQVACGYIYTDKRGIYKLDVTSRLKALDEVIAETDRKIIVFCPFLHALEGIAAHLSRHQVAIVNGSTPRGARDKIFQRFQDVNDSLRVVVAHPQCMAHGLTLVSANTVIWWSPTQSLEVYEQANARINRPGQTSKTLVVHLAGTAVERAVYARLRAKGKMQGILLGLFADQTVEF